MSFDAIVSGLVVNFVSRPDQMLSEMARACVLNGKVGLYVWDYAADMQLMRHFWDAARELDPSARDLDEGLRFPLASRQGLFELLLDARLNDVTTRAIDIPTHFTDFHDYWTPFLGGQGPAPYYAMSLDPARREALRERLRERLPHNPDGSIDLVARAWAAQGTR
jgi:hypothetical protein